MKLFNTATGRKEEFKPIQEGVVGIYICGMTVQSEPHMGHFRTFASFDAVRRYFLFSGYRVNFVVNFTDIDDKVIAKAAEQGIDWRDIAARNEERYLRSARALNIIPPDHLTRATQHIQEIVELVAILVEKGFAYESGGNVYFSVKAFPGYGKLSHKNLDELVAGARVDPDPTKRDPADFALWKARKPGEPYWYSPWGLGRPGWHIECSAMSSCYLGQPFDIHGGGEDLIFPHHENEIAQSECAHDKTFANYWMHASLLNLSGEKMSKSTGLYFSMDEALGAAHPMAIRLYFLKHHYRSQVNYLPESLDEASAAWETLSSAFAGVQELPQVESFSPEVEARLAGFRKAMDDDFNTPRALAECFGLASEAGKTSGSQRDERLAGLALLLGVLGFVVEPPDTSGLTDDLMKVLVETRNALREKKEFALADGLRDRLSGLGITLEDNPEGTTWKRRG